MTPRSTAAVIGGLFLTAFALYGGGGLLVESLTSAADPLRSVADQPTRLAAGAVLMLLNSVAVAMIGVLAHRMLADRSPVASAMYLAARLFEAVVLAVGVVLVSMLGPLADAAEGAATGLRATAEALVTGNEIAFQAAMLGLGLGSVAFCLALLRHRLVPRFLAVWGIAGYAVIAAGSLLELLGLGVGMVMVIPGGLFEVAFGLTLLTRGFSEARPVPAPTTPAPEEALA